MNILFKFFKVLAVTLLIASSASAKFGDETVIGKTQDGKVVLFKYVGYEKHERIASVGEVPLSSLKMPIYSENAEFETQKRDFIKALEERGQQVIELNVFEQEFLSGRTPVLGLVVSTSTQSWNMRALGI